MKKNYLWSVLAIVLALTMSIGFMSCSSDDDDNKNGGNNNDFAKNVIGTWSGKDGKYSIKTLIFKSDNKGIFIDDFEDVYGGRETETSNFTYKPESSTKGIISIECYEEDGGFFLDVFYYIIEGKTMYVYEKGYNDDLEWVLTKQ